MDKQDKDRMVNDLREKIRVIQQHSSDSACGEGDV